MSRFRTLLVAASALGCSQADPAIFGPPGDAGGSGGAPALAGAAPGGSGSGGGQANSGGSALAGGSATAGGAATAGSGGQRPNVDAGLSVLERQGDAARHGHFVRAGLDHAAAKEFFFERDFKSTFLGNVQASPLYLQQGPIGQGLAVVATTAGDVHALDVATGRVVWTRHVADAPPAGSVTCAAGEAFGITSTPVIDPAARTLFVAVAAGTSTLERHELHALSVEDGREKPGFPLDVSQLLPGFDAAAEHQVSALSLVGGVLYAAYGGAPGCTARRAFVVAVDTSNPSRHGAWSAPGTGSGVEAPGGMASDGSSLYVATTGQLLKLQGLASASDDAKARLNAPTLGSSNPVLVDVPGATPSSYVAVLSEDGRFYLRDRRDVGSSSGAAELAVASGFPAAIRTAPAVYHTAKGTYLTLTAAQGVTCPVGSPAPPAVNTGEVVVGLRLEAGAPAQAKIAWCYYLIAGQGAPVATTTDGSQNPIVWFMDDVKLLGVDGDTGQVLFDGGHDVSGIPFEERTCPGVAPYTSPIPVGDRMMIAGNGRLCAWSRR